MIEARDVRMGQWGFSNQVSHHIPYMYNYAGAAREDAGEGARGRCAGSTSAARSARATPATRTTARCRPGTSSARSASTRCRSAAPTYVIGSPLFTKATVHLRGRQGPRRSTRRTTAPQNVYVQGLKVNGKQYDKTYLSHARAGRRRHARLRDGRRARRVGHRRRGRARRRSPGLGPPDPMDGHRAGAEGTATRGPARRRAGCSTTTPPLPCHSAADAVGQWQVTGPSPSQLLHAHLRHRGRRPRASWVLEGLERRHHWTTLDTRTGERFPWRPQTRAFKISRPGIYGTTGSRSPASRAARTRPSPRSSSSPTRRRSPRRRARSTPSSRAVRSPGARRATCSRSWLRPRRPRRRTTRQACSPR